MAAVQAPACRGMMSSAQGESSAMVDPKCSPLVQYPFLQSLYTYASNVWTKFLNLMTHMVALDKIIREYVAD